MRIVIALGGNALLKRGEPMTADRQRSNVRVAAAANGDGGREKAMQVAFRTGGAVGMATTGLGLLGASVVVHVSAKGGTHEPDPARALEAADTIVVAAPIEKVRALEEANRGT